MRYVLCAPPSCKCPVLTQLDDGKWSLEDDYGNKVIITDNTLIKIYENVPKFIDYDEYFLVDSEGRKVIITTFELNLLRNFIEESVINKVKEV